MHLDLSRPNQHSTSINIEQMLTLGQPQNLIEVNFVFVLDNSMNLAITFPGGREVLTVCNGGHIQRLDAGWVELEEVEQLNRVFGYGLHMLLIIIRGELQRHHPKTYYIIAMSKR